METCQTSSTNLHVTGRVKWFNNKAGYGFISITDNVDDDNGISSSTDIFVHNSAINVDKQQYKYLVQGEYVEFDLVKTTSQNHKTQASNVSGIKNGKLMCETRHELKSFRNDNTKLNETPVNMPIQKIYRDTNRPTNYFGDNKSSLNKPNFKEWSIVKNKKESIA